MNGRPALTPHASERGSTMMAPASGFGGGRCSAFFNKPESIENKTQDEDSAEAEDSVDAVAAMFIKAKCDAGRLVVGLMLDPAEDPAEQMDNYKNARNECMAHVEKIQDEFYRGFALNHIIAMCVATGDISVARALLVAVQDDLLRERIFESSPVLREY